MSERTVAVRLTATTAAYEAAMRRVSGATDKFATDAERATAKANAGFKKLGGDLQTVGRTMTAGVTLPLVGAGAAAVKMSMDFETSFTRMVGLAGVAADEVDDLKQSVLDLAGRTAQSPQALADALYQASSSGLDTAQAMAAVEVAAEAAAAGMGASADIVGLVASATAAYGAANIDAARATDILTAAIREGRADPEELAGTLGRVLPIANQLGVSFEEVGGATAYLSNVFGDTNRTVTALQGFLTKLVNPSEQGRQALIDMGTSAEELRAAIDDRGLLGALEILRTHGFEGNAQAMGALFDDIEGRQGALALLADESGTLAETMGAVANSAGSLDEAFNNVAGTDGFKMKQALADLQVALIQAGDVILPVVAGVAGAFGDLARKFSQLPDGAQMVVLGFLAVVAAAGPALVVVGSLIRNFLLLRTALVALRAAMAAHPILAFAAVATTVAVAVGFMGDRTDHAAERVRALRDAMKDAGSAGAGMTAWLTEQVTNSDNLASAMADAGVTVDELAAAAIEGGAPFQDLADRVLAAGKAAGLSELDYLMLVAQIGGMPPAAAKARESLADLEAATASGAAAATDQADAMDYAASRMSTLSEAERALAAEQGWTAESAEKLAAAQQALEDQMQANEDATQSLRDSLNPLVTIFDTLAHQANIVDNALRRVLGGQLSMEEATRGLYDDTAALSEAFKENGRTLDINTEAGRKNRAQVQDSVNGILEYGSAMVGAGHSVDEVTGTLAFLRQGLVDQLTQLGLTEEQASSYIDTLGLTPSNITTAVDIANDELTREKLQGMIDDLEVIDAGASAEIQALVDQGQLAAAERALNNLARNRHAAIMIATGGAVGAHAEGGYVGGPMISTLGEGGKPEVVLPLTKPGRIRALMADPRVSGPILGAVQSADGRTVNLTHTSIAAPTSTTTAAAANDDERMLRQYERGLITLAAYRAYLEQQRAGFELLTDEEDRYYKAIIELDQEQARLADEKAQRDQDAVDRRIEDEDRLMRYLADTGQIGLEEYQAYLGSRRDAFAVHTQEWIGFAMQILAVQRELDQVSKDADRALFDRAEVARELAEAQRANAEADAARTAAAEEAWRVGASRTTTAAEKETANSALLRTEEQLAEAAARLAEALAASNGLQGGTLGWAQFMRERLTADSVWNSANGRLGVADALERILLGVPNFATGGHVPATAGGMLVRVAEGGQGEHIVPDDRMAKLVAATANGGSTTTVYNYSIDIGGVVDRARVGHELAELLQEHNRRNGR